MIALLPILFASLQSREDRQLAERLKLREPKAMGELYDRYGKLAYSLIYRIVRDSSAAEDLLQEAFLRVWNRIQAFDVERGSLAAWVLAVSRNRAIDFVRSLDGRMVAATRELDNCDHPGLFIDLESNILNSDRARLLKAAFEKLTDNQRVVIEMAYFEGLTQTEMAGRLKQPLGTVKTWVRSALKALRNELAGSVKL